MLSHPGGYVYHYYDHPLDIIELLELTKPSTGITNTVLLFLQPGVVGVMRRLKRYRTSSTKPTTAKHRCRQPVRKMKWPKRYKKSLMKPDTRPQAVQQPAILDAVLETTARLTLAATVM